MQFISFHANQSDGSWQGKPLEHSYSRICRPLVLDVSGKEFPNSEPTRPTPSVATGEAAQAVRPAQIVLKRNRPVTPHYSNLDLTKCYRCVHTTT